jgi:hypothetical protein
MKTFIIPLLLLPFFVNAQDVLTYSDTIKVEGRLKADIITKAKVYLAQAFKDSKEVIQMEDKEAGILIGKGSFAYEFSEPRMTCNEGNGKGTVSFTIKLMARDGRFKLDLSDIIHESKIDPNVNFGLLYVTPPDLNSGMMARCRRDIYKEIMSRIKAIRIQIRDGITSEVLKEEGDW